ncbi:hypothetical protein L210DRAFT_3403557, partial [Boletus edulis BED1]
HAAIYQRCWQAMQSLGADKEMLSRYQPLRAEDLKVSTAAAFLNARGHQDNMLSWFWSMDIPKDTERSGWMSKFYRAHWLRAKATKDRWTEEEEILKAEFQWTINFFQRKAEDWDCWSLCSQNTGPCGLVSYAA